MILSNPIRRRGSGCGKPSEDGYILLGVIILLAIFIIGMAAAAPRIAYDIQRDREIETMHRGKQYIRAEQLYYRKFQAYPPSIDALVKTSEIRFLRKRYVDPITGKDDWKTIAYCQNKAPIAMGFFGQPLGPTSGCGMLAGTGPSGGNGLQNGSTFGGGQSGNRTPGGITPGGGMNSPSGGIFSNSPTSATPGPPGTPAPGSPGGNDGSTTGTNPSAPGTAPGTTTGTTDANGNPTSADNGQTLGGGGIIGVSPHTDKKSILVYKKKTKYNEWEFTYGTQMELQGGMMGGNTGAIGQPAGGPGGITPTGGPGGLGPGPAPGGGPAPVSPMPAPPQQ